MCIRDSCCVIRTSRDPTTHIDFCLCTYFLHLFLIDCQRLRTTLFQFEILSFHLFQRLLTLLLVILRCNIRGIRPMGILCTYILLRFPPLYEAISSTVILTAYLLYKHISQFIYMDVLLMVISLNHSIVVTDYKTFVSVFSVFCSEDGRRNYGRNVCFGQP